MELARAEHDLGAGDLQEVKALAQKTLEAISRVRAREVPLLTIATAVGGLFDGRSVWVDPHLQEIERVLGGAEDLLPARIPAMTPYNDEEPQAVRTVDGWVPVRSADGVELVEQPERIERPS